MIITAGPFFNEVDLLLLKCHTLQGVVDAHLIVEANVTFTGIPKPLFFQENKERFKDFNVIHVVVELPTREMNPWDREWQHRKHVQEAVQRIDPEIAIWNDVDELIRPDVVEKYKAMKVETATVEQDFLMYYFDRVDWGLPWHNVKIGKYDKNANPQPWRGQTHHPFIKDGGWHFEFFGKREELLAKLNATSHAPEPGSAEMRRQVSLGECPGLERSSPYPFEKLPEFVKLNRERFENSFSQSPHTP